MARVDFTRNQEDFQAALLGALGFSSTFIQSRTGLSVCQIGYRLGLVGIKRAEYRNGNSEVASYMLEMATRNGVRRLVQNEVGKHHDEKKPPVPPGRRKRLRRQAA
jgi:hypothetical protein